MGSIPAAICARFLETSTPRILARPTASRCGRQLKDQTPDVSDWREDPPNLRGEDGESNCVVYVRTSDRKLPSTWTFTFEQRGPRLIGDSMSKHGRERLCLCKPALRTFLLQRAREP